MSVGELSHNVLVALSGLRVKVQHNVCSRATTYSIVEEEET